MDRFSQVETDYTSLLYKLLHNAPRRKDRTGTGTSSLFGKRLEINLLKGFPLLTTKKINFHAVVHELLWFLRGDTNVKYLQDNGVHIWDSWADDNGGLGPIYGSQWRDTGGIDQIQNVLDQLKEDPTSRRMLVCSWNVAELSKMALAPCHCLFQFYVEENHDYGLNKMLSCHVYQRSADIFLGVPFNIASYALLMEMICHVSGMLPNELIFSYGDIHLYDNHRDQAKEQIDRYMFNLPELHIEGPKDLFAIEEKHIILKGYKSYPAIKAPIAV